MDRPPDIEFSDPIRHDETKLDEQDFDEKDVEVLIHKLCVDSVKKSLHYPLIEVSCIQ